MMMNAETGPDAKQARSREQVWTVLIGGLVLLVGVLSALWLGPTVAQKKAAPAVPQLTPSMVPLVTGEEPIQLQFTKAGCPVCHIIPGIKGAEGRVGPALVLGLTGPQRLADPGYRGNATTVREYVIESILNPGAYVVPGYPDRAMPRWYGQKLSAGALENIAAYLEQVRDTSPSSAQ
ncbi:MAG: hypothetical protein HY581_11615 [Nitrospirae bacterium]|nr:hypothetical protein [Nitrospirota bacterium]